LISSGRQIPTREQRGHLGLSWSGGGILPPDAIVRSSPSSSLVRLSSASSKGTVTRSFASTKYSTPSEQL